MSLCLEKQGTDDTNIIKEYEEENERGETTLERESTPQEGADYIAAKLKGSLEVSLTGPTKDSSKVSAAVSITGERGTVDEESPGCEHPAFGKSQFQP